MVARVASQPSRHHETEHALSHAGHVTDRADDGGELDKYSVQLAQLYHMLGKKTMVAEILKESVEFVREKKWIARSH